MSEADDVPILLERLSRVLQSEAHAGGLKPTQWEALRYLARANRFSRSPSSLTAYLGMTKGTVSQTLIALERKGLVQKETESCNRRNRRLELTEKAVVLLQRDPIEALLEPVSTLSPGDRWMLAEGLTAILHQALRRRGGRPFGVCKSCKYFQTNAPEGAPHRCGLLEVPLSEGDSERICVEQEEAR
jgi:DNA-binding MarR family transcriptional regulator